MDSLDYQHFALPAVLDHSLVFTEPMEDRLDGSGYSYCKGVLDFYVTAYDHVSNLLPGSKLPDPRMYVLPSEAFSYSESERAITIKEEEIVSILQSNSEVAR